MLLEHNGAANAEDVYAAIVLSAEYTLARCSPSAGPELKYNPFLKHWVELVERLQAIVCRSPLERLGLVPDWWSDTQRARLEIAKHVLGLTVHAPLPSIHVD